MAGEHEDQFGHLINYMSHCHCFRKVDILSDTLLRHILCNVHDCPPPNPHELSKCELLLCLIFSVDFLK